MLAVAANASRRRVSNAIFHSSAQKRCPAEGRVLVLPPFWNLSRKRPAPCPVAHCSVTVSPFNALARKAEAPKAGGCRGRSTRRGEDHEDTCYVGCKGPLRAWSMEQLPQGMWDVFR